MKKIGIIITSFLRDDLLYKSIQSIVKNWQEDFHIIIIDQGKFTQEKENWIKLLSANEIRYIQIPFNSGLSHARNVGVQTAQELGCEYSLISSDSFLFNKSIKNLNKLLPLLNDYDVLGLELLNRQTGWKGKLDLIPGKSFELDFLNIDNTSPNYNKDSIKIWDIDICHNFFIAKIDTLINNKWDENLLAMEHEDWAYRGKLNGIKKGWTNYCNGEYIRDKSNLRYNDLRLHNMNISRQYLLKKWNIEKWISYKNLPKNIL